MDVLYMTVLDAAKRYSISRSSVYNLLNTPGCPAVRKFNRKTLIPVAEFDAFFEKQLRTA